MATQYSNCFMEIDTPSHRLAYIDIADQITDRILLVLDLQQSTDLFSEMGILENRYFPAECMLEDLTPDMPRMAKSGLTMMGRSAVAGTAFADHHTAIQ